MAVDFRSFSANGPSDTSTDVIDRRWWTLKPDEAAGSVTATLNFLRENQHARITQYVVSARLYGNLPMMGGFGFHLTKTPVLQNAMRDRITYNVVQSGIDTIVSKISKNKPRPEFLTSGGNWEVQRKAKKLNKFVSGVFYENKAYDQGILVFRDGCVFGDGWCKVFARDGRVTFERVAPSELWADEIEGFYGDPRSLHQVKEVDRQVLLELFPGYRKVIKDAQSAKVDHQTPSVGDMVTVRESWHLPSGPEAKDGKHVITIDGHAITPMEDWSHDWFPFARFRWSPRLYGYWGQGAAEQIQSIQLEVNKLMWLIQRSFHMAGTYKVFLENGSKVVSEHLTNDVGAIVKYTGTKPEYSVPQIVPPEIFQHLLTLKGAAFEQLGISMLSATSQKPAGLNSGKALREYNDIESDRFQSVFHAYQDYYLQLAKLSIAAVKDVAEGTGYKVRVPSKRFVETIDWQDIDLEEDEYVLQCYAVNSLPQEPAGKLETIQEMMGSGLLDPAQGRRLLDFPDLEAVEGLENAALDYLTKLLDKISDDGEYPTPIEPYDNLDMALRLGLEYYLRGKAEELPQERLELLREFIADVNDLQQQAAQAAQMAAAPPAPQLPASNPVGQQAAMPSPGAPLPAAAA